MDAFDKCFRTVIGSEGGLANNSADPGGLTKFGISQRAYPNVDILNLTLEESKRLYKRDYWDRVHGDDLPPEQAMLVFDAAVNNGVSRATRWLQASVGVTQDGIIGPNTLAAVHSRPGWLTMSDYNAERTYFMAGLPQWRVFGRGWSKRLCRLPFQALAMGTVTT